MEVDSNSLGMYFFRQGNVTALSKKEKQELINGQLKHQSSMKRILVSDAIANLLDYVAKNEKDDLLLQGSMVKNKEQRSEDQNPFRVRPSKDKCTIA